MRKHMMNVVKEIFTKAFYNEDLEKVTLVIDIPSKGIYETYDSYHIDSSDNVIIFTNFVVNVKFTDSVKSFRRYIEPFLGILMNKDDIQIHIMDKDGKVKYAYPITTIQYSYIDRSPANLVLYYNENDNPDNIKIIESR